MNRKTNLIFVIFFAAVLTLGFIIYGFLFKPEQNLQNNSLVTAENVSFFMEPDDGVVPVLNAVSEAKSTIELEVYLLSEDTIVNSLIDAQKRGVRVRVILEESPYNGYGANKDVKERLSHYGVETKWGNRVYSFTHSKFFIVDNKTAIIMNLNLTKSSFTKNREFGLISSEKTIVDELYKIFEADWERKPYKDSDTPLVVSPENARNKIGSLLNSANFEILIYAETVEDPIVKDILKKKTALGVKVYCVVADPDNVETNLIAIEELKKYGIKIRYVSSPFIHAKAILIDKDIGYVGSENLSSNSLDNNREVGLLFSNEVLVTSMRKVFFNDFEKGTE